LSIRERRLYYSDSYVTEFTSRVAQCCAHGDEYHVVLEQTAFYPTSGGQPHDTGRLNDVQVLDVFVDGEDVVHVTKEPLDIGTFVTGVIDWERRFDHMQQHCGQHILSACFEQDVDVDTVGFHLGNEIVTIDLAVSELDERILRAVELHANEIVWANYDIEARFVNEEELKAISLRHQPKVNQDIRIVSIGNFDHNACGGTHPRRTGEVGQIKILKTEKSRHGVRVTFVCGKRALVDYQNKVEILQTIGGQLSTGIPELPDSVGKLQARTLQLQKTVDGLKQELAAYRVEEYLKHASVVRDGLATLVRAVEPLSDVQELKTYANACVQRIDHSKYFVVLYGCVQERIHFLVVSSGDMDANAWLKSFLADCGGKGGGNAKSAQGSVPLDCEFRAEVWRQRILEKLGV
jgi:alanyl-tRNA synthetase